MSLLPPLPGTSLLPRLQSFVMTTKLHPILVNLTAALVPVSYFSDLLGTIRKSDALRSTGWHALVYAMIATPFTAITGWLFWMPDDHGVEGMTIHKWLGTAFVAVLLGAFLWRWSLQRRKQAPDVGYFLFGGLVVILLVYQGHLGGNQVFSGM